ncbi:hypothetical protein [Mucilaginibacter phyllosphaerae]|uniref:Lipoprotein n=1 Tax=Mucilaginibacter phyllosphaerae TaxID=1812349 RepID=A0A4Y8ACF5_9SPHI|nr:hypothetical protein [Mucilaginibacter phyllosphaerae]MBB3969490.1 hypothetical protein [Mucilaginibacter phyllosphaerae]TEW65732.1 hypothetical protein E2R65_11345 [Mucilaginibacter phyllosphaerae]GGH08924.1 hypothetical protein GCM10007352_14190 [Mucilaginibacter phyllosphaerae]
MKKLIIIGALSACVAIGGCKGNGSTSGKSDISSSDSTKGLNDGNGAPGSGTGSAGAGTVGDSTLTQQDTVNGAPLPQGPDTAKHQK